MHQQEGKKIKLIFYLFLLFLLSSINNKFFIEKKYSLFKIKEIKVTGLSNEENRKISKEFETFLLRNLLLVNQSNFKEILNKNNLIQSFTVKKKYPNTVNINIARTNF